jgi:hypothetical protein
MNLFLTDEVVDAVVDFTAQCMLGGVAGLGGIGMTWVLLRYSYMTRARAAGGKFARRLPWMMLWCHIHGASARNRLRKSGLLWGLWATFRLFELASVTLFGFVIVAFLLMSAGFVALFPNTLGELEILLKGR